MTEIGSILSSLAARPAAGVATPPGAAAAAAAPADAPDFASVLSDVALGAAKAVRAGETTAIAGLQGKASLQQVVEAVMSAERTLQTAISVRDKAVAAYQEISRMQI